MDGDLDGDEFVDAVLGAPGPFGGWDVPTPSVGRVFVSRGSSAADLATDATLTRDVVGDRLGVALASHGDFNGDGRADLLIGAPYPSSLVFGQAYLWLGGGAGWPSGGPDLALSGTVPGDGFGSAVE
jgi:hypothetical protein